MGLLFRHINQEQLHIRIFLSEWKFDACSIAFITFVTTENSTEIVKKVLLSI
jgi:nucleoid-associated protein YejK